MPRIDRWLLGLRRDVAIKVHYCLLLSGGNREPIELQLQFNFRFLKVNGIFMLNSLPLPSLFGLQETTSWLIVPNVKRTIHVFRHPKRVMISLPLMEFSASTTAKAMKLIFVNKIWDIRPSLPHPTKLH